MAVNSGRGYETLRECLEREYRVEDLKPLARMLCDVVPTRKDDLVKAVFAAVNGDGLKRAFALLHPVQRSAVAEIVHSYHGSFDGGRFGAKYGGPAHQSLNDLNKKKESPWSLFLRHGMMPNDLRNRLAEFVPRPAGDKLHTLEQLPACVVFEDDERERKRGNPDLEGNEKGLPLRVRHTDRAARNNLQTLLRLTDQGKIKVGPQTGHPTAAAMSLVSGTLDGGDWYVPGQKKAEGWEDSSAIGPIQAFAWPVILQGAGLANIDGNTLRLTRAGKAALTGNPPEAIRSLWGKWEKTTFFDEFSRINAIRGQNARGGRHMIPPAYRRPVINTALEECPPGKWIAVDEFGRYMRACDHSFEVSRDLWKLYISEPQYGSLGYAGCGDWTIVEGRYLLAYLFEYAATLGIIDVAYLPPAGVRNDFRGNWGTDELPYLSRYDGLWYFRINPLGAFVLGLSERHDAAAEKPSPCLKVLPNFDIVVVDRSALPPADSLFLNAVAVKTAEAVWRISPTMLLEAAEKGASLDDVGGFLASRSSEPLPQTITALLADVKARMTKFSYAGKGHILSCDDPALATLVAADRRFSSLCMAAGERHICVLPGKEKAFAKAFAELGYTVPRLRELLEL